jgi:AraC-like DNA-binding protein
MSFERFATPHPVTAELAEIASSDAGWVDPSYLPVKRAGASVLGGGTHVGQVAVTWEQWQQPVQVSCGVPDGMLGVVVGLAGGCECSAWGRRLDSNQLGVATSSLDFVLGAGTTLFAARLPKDRIYDSARQLGLRLTASPLASDGLTKMPPGFAETLRQAFDGPDTTTPTQRETETESLLLCSIAGLLCRPESPRLRLSRRTALARAARSYIEEHLCWPFRLDNLTEAVDSDVRRLQRAFRSVYGTSPYRYAQVRRLQLAHRQLRKATPGAVTVAGVANSCGFSHLGRFSTAYRAMFGESPSITLEQSRPYEALADGR